ncbi:Piriformospora indica-insensitive protein 2 [Cardamine amara subsp. amara]|uniref:Piriformospora indica-insensitive protein 2 n=1 Tax=Cardamine amara subsp. amara TaxID=228776 RepID=A0ABD1AAR7_CARAN
MATSHLNLFLFFFLFTATIITCQLTDDDVSPQLTLDPSEQEAVYRVLDSVNSAIPWRTIFPDDLCASPPDGVVCDFIYASQHGVATSVHVTEFHLGYISEFTQNPPCTANSTLNPLLFTAFRHIRKILFYNCFTTDHVSLPETIPDDFGSVLEELVFIENPSLIGDLSIMIGNFTKLRRLVLTGNGFHGSIPGRVLGDLISLEEITLSRNSLTGGFPTNATSRLKNLKILDLSHNFLDGNAPDSIGDLTELIKLDLSFNEFSGEIPSAVGKLKKLTFMDLSYNRFGNYGIPLFLAEMPELREVYLSGNQLGGHIPEIWKNLEGISGIGLSRMGLQGNIPASLGSGPKNLCFLALDNNNLDGEIPEEFGFLEFAREINLANNNLTGKAPFSVSFRDRIGKKLKLSGNPNLHVKISDPPLAGPVLSSSASRVFTTICFPAVLLVLYILMKR